MSNPDEGWSWIVCAVVFINHALSSGFSFSIGVYYVEFLVVFNENEATTSLISSIHLGLLTGIGKSDFLRYNIYIVGSRKFMMVGKL